MTIPQDTRSPHRQQRWIECRNDGATSLAANSVVEILESTRPESGSSETPGGGRTVLLVSPATKDSPELTCILGAQAIAPGGYGFCTMDDPEYARVKSGTPGIGEQWGLASGDAALSFGYYGYIILGGYANGIVRVMKSCCCCA